jgi:hypothetical protein
MGLDDPHPSSPHRERKDNEVKAVSELSGLYDGSTMWVVGRGPSLAHLAKCHFEPGPVVAINQAIEVVEGLGLDNPVYSMQKDHFFLTPEKAPILAHAVESVKESRDKIEGYPSAYVFDNEKDFDIPNNQPSVVTCVRLAKLMGCDNVIFLCCDAATDGITDAYGTPATEPSSYLEHGALVKQHANLPVEWRRVK